MQLKTNTGYSLVETLVAVAMVAAIAITVTSMNQYGAPGERTNYKRICESIANSSIAVIQERGPVETIVPFIQPSGSQINTYATGNPRGTNAAADFFNSADVANFFTVLTNNNPTFSPQLNSYQQIRGSIRTLTSIYNNTAAVRCAWSTFAPVAIDLTRINAPVSINSLAPAVQISLVPFNTATGAEVACAGLGNSLHIAPPPSQPNTNTDAYFVGSGSQALAGNQDFVGAPAPLANRSVVRWTTAGGTTARRDLGLIMKSRVSFTIQGVVTSCEASQRFQYPADQSAPLAPNVAITVGSNTSMNVPDGPTDNCGTLGVASRRAEITVTATNAEAGTVFVCRDLSAIRGYSISANTQTDTVNQTHSVPCVLSTAGIDTSPLSTNLVHPLSTATYPANNFSLRRQNAAGEVWTPCDQTPVCGVAPGVGTNTAMAGANLVTTLRYEGLPQGCLIHMEARSVDTAGNLSAPGLIAPFPVAASTTASDIREIQKPVCGWDTTNSYYRDRMGVLCLPVAPGIDNNFNAAKGSVNETFDWTNPASHPATNWRTRFPNGYYTCRGSGTFGATIGTLEGCCTGFGCTPFR